MCTKEETKQIIHKELQDNIPKIVENAISRRVAKFVLGYWIMMIAVIVSGAGAWFSLYNQVQNNTEKLTEGGRYTQEEHNANAKAEREYVDNRFMHLEEDVSEIKLDVRYIRENI